MEGREGPHPDRDPSKASPAPFHIRKTTRAVPLNSPVVTQVHGKRWMEELQIMCDTAENKLALNGKELIRPIGYGKDEEGNSLPKLHEGDLYLCSESLNALQGCLGGVCDAVDAVFGDNPTQRAFVCIRPPGHHCSSNYPSGFCWLNNVHVGITHAASSHGLTHAAIIDFDLHHGDGSQSVVWSHNSKAAEAHKNATPYAKTPIGYYSLHDINSYPCEMGDEEKVKNASLCIDNAHGQSIWNVHLEAWKDHAEFWKLYESKYLILLEKTKKFLKHHSDRLSTTPDGPQPKAAIFLSAGFDASEWEGAGMQRHKVNVPTEFYARFTKDVVALSEELGLGADGRVISVLEGGYSNRALTSGVLSHICGLTHNAQATTSSISGNFGLAEEMQRKLKLSSVTSSESHAHPAVMANFDAEWWALEHLEALELAVDPDAHEHAAKKVDKGIGNYSSPTHASTARMSEQARERRSLSAQSEARRGAELEPNPLPQVDWCTAAYELSRLIIPSDRQTLSCRHDELNGEASKSRRARQSDISVSTEPDQKMQLRDRRAKAPEFAGVKPRVPSRTNRRITIAGAADLPEPHSRQASVSLDTSNVAIDRQRRRSSAVSSMISGFDNMNIGGSSAVGSRDVSEAPSAQAAKVAPVRKPRAPPPPKTTVEKKRASPRKVPAKPASTARVPLNMSIKAADADITSKVPRKPGSKINSALTSPVDQSSTSDVLGDLTNGMKKMSIKLKVPTPEENAMREKQKDEELQRKAKVPRKPAVSKASKTSKASSARTSNGTAASSSSETKVDPEPALPNADPVMAQAPLTHTMLPQPEQVLAETPQIAPILTSQDPPTVPDANALMIGPIIAETPAPASFMSSLASEVDANLRGQEEIEVHRQKVVQNLLSEAPDAAQPQILKEHQSQPQSQPQPRSTQVDDSERKLGSPTPGSGRSKADLPVFTSDSPIPFASAGPRPGALQPESNKSESKPEASIWEVPETPARQ